MSALSQCGRIRLATRHLRLSASCCRPSYVACRAAAALNRRIFSQPGAHRLRLLGMTSHADGAAAAATVLAAGTALSQEPAAADGPVVQYVVLRRDLRDGLGWPLVRRLLYCLSKRWR